jgi:hypothetical protein
MTIELLIVAAVVAAAAAYLARMGWQMYAGKRSTCGCGESSCPKQVEQRAGSGRE